MSVKSSKAHTKDKEAASSSSSFSSSASAPRRSVRERHLSEAGMMSLLYACEVADDDEEENECEEADESEPIEDKEDDVDDHDSDGTCDDGDDVEIAAPSPPSDDEAAAAAAPAPQQQHQPQQRRSRSSSSSRSHVNRPTWLTTLTLIVVPGRHRRAAPSSHQRTTLSPLQLLQLFIPPDLVELWCEYSNNYHQVLAHTDIDTSVAELYAFIAAHIFMGIVRLPALDMYWQAETRQPFISSLFSRTRFQSLLRCFCITKLVRE
jgi:hypothetical protein